MDTPTSVLLGSILISISIVSLFSRNEVNTEPKVIPESPTSLIDNVIPESHTYSVDKVIPESHTSPVDKVFRGQNIGDNEKALHAMLIEMFEEDVGAAKVKLEIAERDLKEEKIRLSEIFGEL